MQRITRIWLLKTKRSSESDRPHNQLTLNRYEAYLKERKRAQEEDASFPDEIDTPRHIAARARFQRFRGLRSFRTSPWDPYENLPLEYGEVFQFENFSATQKRVIREAIDEGIEVGALGRFKLTWQVGTRVVLVIRDVPRSVVSASPSAPIVVHGLLQHEHKQTVLHFAVQRNTEYTEPVRAKVSWVMCFISNVQGPGHSLRRPPSFQYSPSAVAARPRRWQGRQQCPQVGAIPASRHDHGSHHFRAYFFRKDALSCVEREQRDR